MAQDADKPSGKGRPTPKRKDREAERLRPLVLDRKADSKKRRDDRRRQFHREQEAMRTGDERNMPPQHQGAPRRFARDFVDARMTVAEFLLPLSFITLFVMIFLVKFPEIVAIASLALLLTMIVAGFEAFFIIRRLRKKAIEKFGEDKIPRLYRLYGVTRVFQFRRMRTPKPQVKRYQYPS